MLLFGAAYAAPNKVTAILYRFRFLSVSSPTEKNSKIRGLFKAFERFSSIFQGRFNLQGLFKHALHIQVLFKHVQTLGEYSSNKKAAESKQKNNKKNNAGPVDKSA